MGLENRVSTPYTKWSRHTGKETAQTKTGRHRKGQVWKEEPKTQKRKLYGKSKSAGRELERPIGMRQGEESKPHKCFSEPMKEARANTRKSCSHSPCDRDTGMGKRKKTRRQNSKRGKEKGEKGARRRGGGSLVRRRHIRRC